jgi:hypothetical protein
MTAAEAPTTVEWRPGETGKHRCQLPHPGFNALLTIVSLYATSF